MILTKTAFGSIVALKGLYLVAILGTAAGQRDKVRR